MMIFIWYEHMGFLLFENNHYIYYMAWECCAKPINCSVEILKNVHNLMLVNELIQERNSCSSPFNVRSITPSATKDIYIDK